MRGSARSSSLRCTSMHGVLLLHALDVLGARRRALFEGPPQLLVLALVVRVQAQRDRRQLCRHGIRAAQVAGRDARARGPGPLRNCGGTCGGSRSSRSHRRSWRFRPRGARRPREGESRPWRLLSTRRVRRFEANDSGARRQWASVKPVPQLTSAYASEQPAASDRVRPPRPDHAALGAPPRPSGGPAHQRLALVARARSGVLPTESRGRSGSALVLDRGDAGGGGPASRGDPRRGVDGRGERGLGRDREELLRRPATRLRRGAHDPAPARLSHDPVLPVWPLGERRGLRHRGCTRVRNGGDHHRPARGGGGVLAPARRRALAVGRRGRRRDRRGRRLARPAGLSRAQPRE